MSHNNQAQPRANQSSQSDPQGQRGLDPPSAQPEAPTIVDTFPAHVHPQPIDTYQDTGYRSAWKRGGHAIPRPHSPALPWHKEYSQLDPKQGRVLVIDFIRADQTQNRKRKVVAQELDSLEGLKKLYKDPRRGADANLRLLHVQNAPWATKFLLRKFNIDGRDELVGSNFGRYARFTKPDRRGGKPFPNAKSWRVQHDPWRGISKTSFGFEYLKECVVKDPTTEGRIFDEKMMELNGYDDDENPAFAYDVYIQRLACYVQHKEDAPSPPFDGANGISNPYKKEPNGHPTGRNYREYLPQLSSLDNENAIILFDNSQTGSFEDCLIAARSEWETHWRRLPFYLAYEAREIVGNDDLLGRQCARMILDDVFRALVARWEAMLNICQTHVSILEDKVYEQPADETRAPELWRNSSLWLQLAKLATAHIGVVRDMRVRLRELVSDITAPSTLSQPANSTDAVSTVIVFNDDDWLEEIPGDFDRIARSVEEDLIKPTQALISLLYQSVSIRDSRLSLQIDTSMWRLSWITFIFLPLTFMVGFFGMNVDTFSGNPSIKWYFIVAIPFMLCVVVGWYVMKHILARQRQTPYQRGIYESFFHDLAVNYPSLWSRTGPRDSVIPGTRLDRWKWMLIQRWSRPERTIKAGQANADTAAPDDLSSWSKIKRFLIRTWTNDLITFRSTADHEMMELIDTPDLEQGSNENVNHLLAIGLLGATEMLTVPGQPAASVAIERLEQIRGQQAEFRDRINISNPQHGGEVPSAIAATAAAAAAAGPVPGDVLTPTSPSPTIPQTYSQNIPSSAPSPPPIRFLDPTMHNSHPRSSPPLTPQERTALTARRLSSPSPRGRRPRPISGASNGSRSGSASGSRNSGVLIEEEDPRWICALGREGHGWYWRPGSQSPGPGSGRGGSRRRSSGNNNTNPSPAGLKRKRQGSREPDGTISGGDGTAGSSSRVYSHNRSTSLPGPGPTPSPLGFVITSPPSARSSLHHLPLGSDTDDEPVREGQRGPRGAPGGPALLRGEETTTKTNTLEEDGSSPDDDNDEAIRAAEETGGRK